MDPRGARILITDKAQGRIWEEYVDPRDTSMGLPGMAQAVEAMRQTLPAHPRRTPRQRYESMLNKVLPDMLRMYRETGAARWPRSVQVVLDYLAEREHDPTLAQPGGVEQVIRQGKALVRYTSERSLNEQTERDRKKVTLDWSGH
jgi:hypothetical protein